MPNFWGHENHCDCCTLVIEGDHITDDEVCQGSDDPGFFLCNRPECLAKHTDLSVEDRRKLFAEGRAKIRGPKVDQDALDKEIEAMRVPMMHSISGDRLNSMLVSAFEGGSNYWAKSIEIVTPPTKPCKFGSDIPFFGGALKVIPFEYDVDADKIKLVTMDTLREGLAILSEKYPHHAADIVNDNPDAGTGDALLQCAIFGDLIYG